MRQALIDALAWTYDLALTLGPFVLAALIATLHEARTRRRIEATIRGEGARGELSSRADAFLREQALWKRFGWRSWVLFAVSWVAFYLLADFVRFNAHAIIRATAP